MLRVAIVGLGPKGLFALERLLDRAGAAPITIDVFEPHPVPGAGPNYDPRQPNYLRMNIPAGAVDAWSPGSTTVPAGERRAFVAWSGGEDPNAYAPRAQVGRYLADALATLLRHLPDEGRVTVCPTRVQAISRRGDRWEVVAAGTPRTYDEVLLATGHEQPADRGLPPAAWPPAPLVTSVFPVQRQLCRARVPPGATVAVRGFALTFIDAALTLTEGRGGSFQALDHPYRMRYRRGNDDVGVLLPFSRTGRPMLAKSTPAADAPALVASTDRGGAQIADLGDGFDLRRDLLPILATAAGGALRAVRTGCRGERTVIDRWLSAAADGGATLAPSGAAEHLERSLAIGAGLAAADEVWALGHVWRTVYPTLVSRLGGGGLGERDWPAFHLLAAEMERIAFGPAPGNVAKLLALIDAGVIDLRHVHGGVIAQRGERVVLRSGSHAPAVDVVIDAVLAAPGAVGVRSQPLRDLLDQGHVRVASGRRGLDVDPDGTCRATSGALSTGLSAIGRATEDVVIGNDTLNRALHPHADRWAGKVAERGRGQAHRSAGPVRAVRP